MVLLREGSPDPWLADYSGKTPLDLALDCGRSRLEIADALALYAATEYAPSIGVFLAAADRVNCLATRAEEGGDTGADASLGNLIRCPFRYLSALGSDTLGLIKLFVTAPPMATLATLDDNRARAKGEGYRSAHYAGYMNSDGSPRGSNKDAQKYESDPRARSLPYLMRQSGQPLAATAPATSEVVAPPNAVSTSTPTPLATSANAKSVSVATRESAVAANSATWTQPALRTDEEAELALAIAASLNNSL